MRQYALITACYWVFTITDGALRMLVVLYFHQLGYSPLDIALLFLFYEFFGVVTNLGGGWVAARFGLAVTLLGGLALQIVALGMLTVDASVLSILYVMCAQAISGIAKDLNKMSAKSSVKSIAESTGDGPAAATQTENRLYRLVALLTGSKNALKGLGFFVGGALLQSCGFQNAMWVMISVLLVVGGAALFGLDYQLGKTAFKPKFNDLLSKSRAINMLSGARFFLFGARDIWFVVALPVYLQLQLSWSSVEVGTFLAIWVIGYGAVQAAAPRITRTAAPDSRLTALWGVALLPVPAAIALGIYWGIDPGNVLVGGLLLFGALFAINSALHSFLIVNYAEADGVTLDVGFYYMSNAAGRLVGSLLSGLIYQQYGLATCLVTSSAMLICAAALAAVIPGRPAQQRV